MRQGGTWGGWRGGKPNVRSDKTGAQANAHATEPSYWQMWNISDRHRTARIREYYGQKGFRSLVIDRCVKMNGIELAKRGVRFFWIHLAFYKISLKL